MSTPRTVATGKALRGLPLFMLIDRGAPAMGRMFCGRYLTMSQVARAMQMDAADVEHAIEEHGRCDNAQLTVIPIEP